MQSLQIANLILLVSSAPEARTFSWCMVVSPQQCKAWIVAAVFGCLGAMFGFFLLSGTYGAKPFLGPAVFFLGIGAKAYRKALRE
jgi:hypothetical protein